VEKKEELIQRLSKVHKNHSTDPAVLCSACSQDFDFNSPDFGKTLSLREELLKECQRQGEKWVSLSFCE